MRISLSILLSLVSALSLQLASVHAITIDEFDGSQFCEAKPGQGAQYSSAQIATALGGTRGVEAFATPAGNPFNRLLLTVFGGSLSCSQDNQVTGYSLMSWDGDVHPAFLTPTGLNDFDLIQDGGSAFQFELLSFDYPSQQALPLIVTVYDYRDSSLASTATLLLDQQIPPPNVNLPVIAEIPFNAFQTAAGANGPADFSHVGAITLKIDGTNTPAADILFDWFGTNGLCRNMPDTQGKVIDVCGVCGGNGSSCTDCSGVPFGSAQLDRCDVCQGDGMSCLGCTEVDLKPKLGAMDGGAKKQEQQIKYLISLLLKYKKTPANIVYAAKAKKTAHTLQIRNWTISWQLPGISTTCTNVEFCSAASNEPILIEYRKHNDELRNLALDVAKRVKKAGKTATKLTNSYLPKVKALHKANYDRTNEIPTGQYSCSAP